MASFGLGEYVQGHNELYDIEGKIIRMCESTGTKKGLLYEIELYPNSKAGHYFFEDEIKRLVMPTMYEHTLEEMAKEWFYLYCDKRLARVNIYKNPTRKITKGEGDKIYISFTAYGKNHVYFNSLKVIKDNFSHKRPSEYAHNKC